jgi:hypothetical protein
VHLFHALWAARDLLGPVVGGGAGLSYRIWRRRPRQKAEWRAANAKDNAELELAEKAIEAIDHRSWRWPWERDD